MGRVLVVGAGISGLTATKVLLDDGFDVTCVEQQDSVGGCWNTAFDFVLLQSSRDEYHFPGVPFPDGTPVRPGKKDILSYWNRFVDMFDLRSRIFLDSKMLSLRFSDNNCHAWQARIHYACNSNSPYSNIKHELYDFVVIATGLGYGDFRLSRMPDFIINSFPGRVVHAADLKPDELPNKNFKIVLVGYGPTAVAFAEKYARVASDKGHVHLVVREPRWVIPRRILGIIPYCSIIYTRALSMMVPAFAHCNLVEKLIHLRIFKLFVRAFWWLMSFVIIISAQPPRNLIPRRETFLDGLQSTISVLPNNLFEYCRAGHVNVHVPATLSKLCRNGDVVLSNGDVINDVKLVVCCTGYRHDPLHWLSPDLRSLLNLDGQPRQLYRHILIPGITNMAFVGFGGGFHGCLMEYISSNWVSSLFLGELNLPSKDEMEANVEGIIKWKKHSSQNNRYSPYAVGIRYLTFIDELLQDLDINIHRKRNPFSWFLAKWVPDDYMTVQLERRRARQRKLSKQRRE